MAPRARHFDDLTVDHVEFYVGDVAGTSEWLTAGYGLHADEPVVDPRAGTRTAHLTSGGIRLRVTQPLSEEHAGSTYLRRHGDGVADIALRVRDAEGAFAEAVRRGAQAVSPPRRSGSTLTASILGFGDVVHTFVERPHPVGGEQGPANTFGLTEVDHFAVCLETGTLDSTVAYYEEVLDFEMIFTEKIVVGAQAMDSKVVQSRSGGVTLTLIEPDPSRDPGQIDDFLAAHGGSGVQHIAFSVPDIVHTVSQAAGAGVDFLTTPAAYYRLLGERLTPARHSIEDLGVLSILVDEDHDGQLFQIFARSVHPRNTFFLELIERMGARTFGSGNIKALYEAVEAQRAQERAA